MVRIDDIDIDDHILDKIEQKHGVSFVEAEQVCLSGGNHIRQGRDGMLRVFGQTEAGRYLLVVLARHQGQAWKVVTARDMSMPERRLFQSRRQ